MENEDENGKPLDQDNESVSGDLWSDQEKDKEDENDEESDSNDSISGDSACDNVDGGCSSDSSSGGSEKCAICLQRFSGQEIGSPETCEHHFCLKCITEWSKKVATCPVDRKIFPAILVKQELFGSVTRIVDVEVGNTTSAEHFDDYDTDPTYCEICGHCDREDRLLLCDGCDLGYHLECLEPPMEYVPIEDWYCTTCQVQRLSAEQRIVERPTRQQIRLPRTGQSRRILQSIRQYVSRSILSVENETPQATFRRTTTRKSQSRKRKRTTKNGKGTGRKSKRRMRKGKFKRSRVAIHRRPSTARGRIAAQLGILPPRPGQIYVGLPRCRTTSAQSAENSNSSTLRNLRYQAGITPLRMYSNSEDLADYLEQYSDDEGSGGVARAHAVHHRIGIPLKPSIPAAAAGFFNVPALNSASPDVLGPILNNQIIMLTDRNIQIRRDGTLIPSISQSTPSSSTAVTSIRRNSITNENTKRGYESSSAENNCSLKLKGPSSIFRAPVNSCPSLSSVNGSVRQVPTSPNSSDSNSNTDTGNNSNVCSSNSKNNGNNSENQLSSSSDYSGAPWKTDNSHGASMFCNDDPNGTKAYENYLYSASSKSPKSNTERRKSLEPSESEAKNPDDDEEYNIYSDIEEDNGQDTDTLKQAENESEAPMLKEKDRERDSDSDMVIDEDETVQVKNTYQDSKSIAESLPETHSGTNLETRSISPNENISTAFNLPSPNSIPLPDSTPPSSPPMSINDDKDEDMETLPEHFISSPETDSESWCKNKTKGRAKEEYDPSQPLTSSDEDEPSGQMAKVPITPRLPSKQIKQQPEVKKPQVEVSVTEVKLNIVSPSKDNVSHSKSPADEETDIDLNSIPMPPSEDYRRPTIQFSIPARHKLLSISSLIKRQKGVAKKENKSAMSFTSEISKAFGEEKQDESDDDDGRSDERGGRLSLVAEIFGSDDEEEKPAKLPQDDNHHSREMHFLMKDVTDEQQPGKPTTTESNPTVTQEAPLPAIRMASSLFVDEGHNSTVKLGTNRRQSMEVPSGWKNIAGDDDKIEAVVEPPGPTKEKETVIQDEEKSESAENDAGSCSDASIAVLQTVGHSKKKDDNDDVIVLNILSSEKRSEGSKKLRCGDKLHVLESISDEDSEFESVSTKPTSNTRNIQKGSSKKIRTIDREQSRTEDHAKKSTKRKRSISLNNREEGEIIDSPGKQRKKKKEKKKGKKRRKSKEDTPPVKFDFVEKKVPDAPLAVAANSSSEENMGGNQISWRKPSNSTKERNYRDGKPKADEKYFKPRDKKRDPSPNPRDRRGKHQREPSLTIEKDKTVKEKDLKRSRRRSHSPRSRSRSYSKSRNSSKRYHSRSNHGSVSPNKSFHSRSRSRSLRRSRKHGWFSTSPRRSRTRSNSRSPIKPRSRSPIKRSRYRKRSLSNNRPRRVKGRKRSVSSSSSTSSKRERRKRNKDKPVAIEKVKKKKEKERGKEKGHKTREPKEKEKEKDKTKRKRRREKSLSPAKEIFADGDSIVVSLNFQKTPTVSSTPNHTSSTKDSSSPVRGNENEKGKSSKKDGRGRAHARHRRSHENDENGKPRLLKKTLLIDLESSPIQEQNIGVSPTLIVLSDDEEEKQLHRKSDRLDAKDSSNNKDGAVVTTSGCNDGHSNDGSSPYRHGVAADSTQLQHPNQSDSKMDDEPFSISCASVSPYENSNLSPTRGDSVVTSTRDSEIGLPHDNDSQSPPSFLHAKLSDAKNLHQPRSPGTPPQPVPPVSPPSHLMLDACNVNNSTPTSSVLSHNMPNHPTNSVSLPISDKPLIGNIPGLFPSSIVSASSTGNINIPPPIVIPTPPTPQMRFGTSQPPSLNQGLLMPPNVLASVANALYGPLLAARQQQQQQHLQQPQQQMNSSMLIGGKFSNSVNSSGGIGNKLNQQGSVLLPKNQNSHSLNYELGGGNVSKSNNSGRLAGDGDSPFSPNSSDGDDLFEPPLDRSKLDSSGGSNKPEKNLGQQSSNSSSQIQPSSAGGGNVGSGTGKSRDKNNLFDNLFGSAPSKKSSSHPKSHNKSAKSKGGTHQKSKTKRVAKKEISKLSEGELRLTEDVPTSAVELRVKEKVSGLQFLKKLNRQERVVEEVKLSLKPHYSKKHVTKDEYKEILRRAVPKICHNKSGEINPFKIKELVEAYVKKFRHSRKIE